MNKKTLTRIAQGHQTLKELLDGATGAKPFRWGEYEREQKVWLLSQIGFVLVSKTKLEKGGHRLKKGAKPVGAAYYGSPLRLYADLYLLGVQTERTLKWHDLYQKGKALVEDGSYAKKPFAGEVQK